ncbi:hypothetical protein CEXT_60301 [Caerostris extrusa]|uniref:Uncharacterized protein n=1 Tax=Caerostris extrusa TaxID=172846 RepID=A0AAV4RJN3_CAEEX|nr:hypothetical protein CEXT_60301 [Caerostris extrusa]
MNTSSQIPRMRKKQEKRGKGCKVTKEVPPELNYYSYTSKELHNGSHYLCPVFGDRRTIQIDINTGARSKTVLCTKVYA